MKEPGRPLHVICEVEAPIRPHFDDIDDQLRSFGQLTRTYLIPDCGRGRAAISNVAIAKQVIDTGMEPIVCMNCRDRNTIGVERDVLTSLAYGVSKFLCLYGDPPGSGERCTDLTVGGMIDTIRNLCARTGHPEGKRIEIGITSTTGKMLPEWKKNADFCLLQMSFEKSRVETWLERNPEAPPTYAGVIVLSSMSMAATIQSLIPEDRIPDSTLSRLDSEGDGIGLACEYAQDLSTVSRLTGIHLIPVKLRDELARRFSQVMSVGAAREES